jgi:choline dehydrogenase
MIQLVFLIAALSLAIASSGSPDDRSSSSTLKKRASGVTSNAGDVAGQTYDYVIVGGGLTGLTVASRLSEDSDITVLVIETGADNRDDPRVYDIYDFGEAFGTELDWQFATDYGKTMVA